MLNALDVVLFINKDFVEVGAEWASASAFNLTDSIKMKNAILELEPNEQLNLSIYNTDSLDHTLTVNGILESNNIIPAFSNAQFTLQFSGSGTYRYYSDVSYGKLIGASGIILVGHTNAKCFFWNLFEMNVDLSNQLANQEVTDLPIDFQPEYFFINGNYFPNTIADTDTYVEVQLGDTVIISILNSGNMEHVLHFHGFHVEVLHSNHYQNRVGWIKDSLPLDVGSTITVQLIADQEGIYPVHDHNLIAVTNAGIYIGGMLTQIKVLP